MFGLVKVEIPNIWRYIIGTAIIIVLFFGIRGCVNNMPSEDEAPVDYKAERDSISVVLDSVISEMGVLVEEFEIQKDSVKYLLDENSRLFSSLNSFKYKKRINEIKNSPPIGDPVLDSLYIVYYEIDSTRHTIRGTKKE